MILKRVPAFLPKPKRFTQSLVRLLAVLFMLTQMHQGIAGFLSQSHAQAHVHGQTEFSLSGDDHHSHSDEDRAIHQHEHNPSDHSHEKPSPPPISTLVMRGGANLKFDDLKRSRYSSPLSLLYRPPRHLLIA